MVEVETRSSSRPDGPGWPGPSRRRSFPPVAPGKDPITFERIGEVLLVGVRTVVGHADGVEVEVAEVEVAEVVECVRRGGPRAIIVDVRTVDRRTPASTHVWIDHVVGALSDCADDCCVVTTRHSVRSTRRTGVATFTSIGDALQAHALAQIGYGDGWQLGPLRS